MDSIRSVQGHVFCRFLPSDANGAVQSRGCNSAELPNREEADELSLLALYATQAIELSAEALSNVKFVQEKKLIQKYFDEIAQDTGRVRASQSKTALQLHF